MSRNFKIFGLYLAGIISIICYYMMSNSTDLRLFLEKSNRYRTDSGFATYSMVGLIQYGLLIGGVGIICFLTFFLFQKDK
ncbi:unnamed protein product [Scytosiphon promiscuus]